MTEPTSPQADQAHAAFVEATAFRAKADAGGHFLHRLAGPIAVQVAQWASVPIPGRCQHITESPRPLWALLDAPGRILCRECFDASEDATPTICVGCRAPLPGDDADVHAVAVALSPHMTGLGYACPDCRALCHTTTADHDQDQEDTHP